MSNISDQFRKTMLSDKWKWRNNGMFFKRPPSCIDIIIIIVNWLLIGLLRYLWVFRKICAQHCKYVVFTSYNQSRWRHIPAATTVRPAVTSLFTLVEVRRFVSQRVIVALVFYRPPSTASKKKNKGQSASTELSANRLSPSADGETDATRFLKWVGA